jgi:hypothetical protein
MRWEARLGTGQACYYLAKFREALAELTGALEFVLHPTEKHVTEYWIARTHDAVCNQGEAFRHYQSVAADPIPSWMRECQRSVKLTQPRAKHGPIRQGQPGSVGFGWVLVAVPAEFCTAAGIPSSFIFLIDKS